MLSLGQFQLLEALNAASPQPRFALCDFETCGGACTSGTLGACTCGFCAGGACTCGAACGFCTGGARTCGAGCGSLGAPAVVNVGLAPGVRGEEATLLGEDI